MKLQIRTLDRRTFQVQFSEFKTVGDLKEYVCRLRGTWVHPEAQQLIYAGQVLDEKERLRTYCIDERKYLLMLTRASKPKQSEAHVIKQTPSEARKAAAEERRALAKRVIMRLGPWTETDVRQALQINLNVPSRAISYLKENKKPFEKMITPPASNLQLSEGADWMERTEGNKYELSERTSWNIINPDKFFKPVTRSEHLRNLKELMDMGFPSDTAFEAYSTCCGDTEAAANLLMADPPIKPVQK